MLHNWIGDDNFRRGMSQYLTKYAYKVQYLSFFQPYIVVNGEEKLSG
jgi:hypothetical protein